eukprot:SAG11_NODE_239_length_11783_cov_52.724923_10_plen_595_part_00
MIQSWFRNGVILDAVSDLQTAPDAMAIGEINCAQCKGADQMSLALAVFLLGMKERQYFGNNAWSRCTESIAMRDVPELGWPLGKPQTAAPRRTGNASLARTFESGTHVAADWSAQQPKSVDGAKSCIWWANGQTTGNACSTLPGSAGTPAKLDDDSLSAAFSSTIFMRPPHPPATAAQPRWCHEGAGPPKSWGCWPGYWVPSLSVTPNGTLLAFATLRSSTDHPNATKLMMKRSDSGGKSWGAERAVAGSPRAFAWGAAMAASVASADHVHLIYAVSGKGSPHGEPSCFLEHLSSATLGESWTEPACLDTAVTKSYWEKDGLTPGPGAGLALPSGRVLFAVHGSKGARILYSDTPEEGSASAANSAPPSSWRLSNTSGWPAWGLMECQLARLVNGSIVANCRTGIKGGPGGRVDNGQYGRGVSLSHDNGEAFGEMWVDSRLWGASCQGSLAALGPSLVFAIPAAVPGRAHLSVRQSSSSGLFWDSIYPLFDGPSGYSSMSVLPGGHSSMIVVAFESGDSDVSRGFEAGDHYKNITFSSIPLACFGTFSGNWSSAAAASRCQSPPPLLKQAERGAPAAPVRPLLIHNETLRPYFA